jgi:plastocyanin
LADAVSCNRRAVLAAALLVAPAVAQAAAGKPRMHVIRIRAMAFDPAPSGIRVGDTIEWVNADMFQHTATARNGAFDVDIKAGAKARIVVKAAGTTLFYCRYHPGMTGKLVAAP